MDWWWWEGISRLSVECTLHWHVSGERFGRGGIGRGRAKRPGKVERGRERRKGWEKRKDWRRWKGEKGRERRKDWRRWKGEDGLGEEEGLEEVEG